MVTPPGDGATVTGGTPNVFPYSRRLKKPSPHTPCGYIFFVSAKQKFELTRMAEDICGKKNIKGGPRKCISFDVCKEIVLAEGSVEKCFDFDCGCEPNCFWKCLNNLPEPYQTVRNLRSDRFIGHNSCKRLRPGEWVCMCCRNRKYSLTPGCKKIFGSVLFSQVAWPHCFNALICR